MVRLACIYAIAGLLLVGCGQRAPKEADIKTAYDKITVGMTRQQVMEVMWEFPNVGDEYYLVDKQGNETRILITYQDDKVVDKSIKSTSPMGPGGGAGAPAGGGEEEVE